MEPKVVVSEDSLGNKANKKIIGIKISPLNDEVKRSEFYNDSSIYRDKHGASLQCDNTNFSGTPNLKCNQTYHC